MKKQIKRILIITSITVICLFGIFIYLTTTDGIYFGRNHHRYNKVITTPLAKMGIANAQYKMGVSFYEYFLYPPDEAKAKDDLEKAIYWWKKAAAKGNEKAIKALAETEKLLEEKNKEE